ncbi:MAG TPA: nuclear transport factor 2 family protein, partial [Myxococcota bacterium]|nr:nuclear transport factor 2 family protein [Myxococcota bacterium]
WGSLVRAQSPIVRSEPLATLGDSLALFRTSMSFSALAAGDVAPFGAVTREEIVLVEAGPTGHQRRIETFAPDHLADAVARLYERHADSLPEGPARLRARATARVIGVLMAPPALEPYRTVFAPDVAWADHRTLGFGSLRGSKALLGAFQSLFDSSAELAVRVEDVLALESNALLVRWTVSGTDRAGGGAFERQFLLAWAFGEDGLVIHSEQFDADDVDIALARIEQLAVESPEARVTRRVRLNAATANAARTEAAVAARDFEAFQGLFADGARNVHHPTGSAFAESESMESYRRLLNAEEVAMRHEPLATLGDSLALFRASVSFRSLPSSDALGPFGAVHTELLLLLAVDGAGRRRLSEVFAPDRLGDAVTRSYELFAEAVPEGPARTRAEATARSIATMVESLDPDRFATAIAPGVEFADHGPIGIGSSRGEKAILRGLAALHGLAAEVAVSEEDVLAMQPDLLLTRCTTSGTDRASGGPFERHFLALWVFGSDGLATRVEWFAPDGEAEAFARIDALTSPVEAAQPRVRPNAATANATRLDAAAAARDFAAFKDQFAEGAQVVHHPTATTFAQSRNLQAFEWLLQAPAFEFANRPIATLGDSLALLRASLWVDATTDQEIGETVNEWLLLTEVDAEGRRVLSEFFPTDRASDAIVRLYERYAESLPEGEARNAAERVARSLRAMFDAPDLERLGRAFGPEIELVDRSALGMWSARGVAAALEHFRTLAEVASNVAFHDYEILRLEPRAALVRRTHSGIDRANGGAYETRLVLLLRFGGDGRLDRVEWFDADRETEAQARFDELTAESWTRRRQVRPNAATANAARVDAAIAARDLDALARAFAQQAEIVHHPTGAAYDQRGVLSNWRSLLGARDVRFATLPLATLGDSLALCRGSVSFSSLVAGNEESFGAVAKEEFLLIEVDAAGRRTRIEFFALDRLADAITRLYERYAESLPQGPRRERAAEAARSASLLASPFEFDRSAQALARDVTFVDHRPLGLGTGVGVEGLASWLGSLPGTTDDLVMRIDDVLVLLPDQLLVTTTSGGRFRASGGTFEQRSVQLYRTGPDGRVARVEWFDPEKLDDALARSDELAADSTSLANLASRTMREFERAWRARDWNAVLATFVPTHHMDDRRRLMRVAISGADFLANERMLFEGAASEWRGTLLATRGGRLALLRMRFRTEIEGSGPMAVEMLDLVEVDAAGRRSALVVFDLDDLEAAYAELDRRYLAGEGAPVSPPVENAATRSLDRLTQAWASRDWEGVVATLGAGFRQIDRRPMMQLDLDREQFLAFMREVYDMSSSRLVFEILATRGSRLALARLRFEGADDSLGFTEIESLAVLETDAQGMRQAMVRFPTDDLAAAQRELEARYAALEGSQSSDPLLIPPNAASRTGDRLQRAIEVRDWDGVRALFAPVLEYEDRRRGAQLQGDHETFLASARTYAANQERMKRTLLATAGDRHSLTLLRRSGTTPDVEAWEVESLSLLELDAEGRIARVLAFDPSDRSKASAEMFERYARGEGASALSPLACEGIRAMNARDLERLRAALPDDFVLCDRRRTGLGLIRGAGAFIRSLAALFEVSRESWVETLYTLELQPHGELAMARVLGTLRDGGAFESAYLRIITREGSMELFEPEDLELARARFEELRPK